MFRGRAEKAFGRVERHRVDASGERAPARRHREVVGAGKSGDRVEQNRHVASGLDQTLGALQRHLGDLGVILDGLIER